MMTEIISEYKEILKKLSEENSPWKDSELHYFFPLAGGAKPEERVMCVGRAVNSWTEFIPSQQRIEDINFSENALPDDVPTFFKNYNMNKSAFWRVIRGITMSLFKCEKNDFGKNLIYSNLYKISTEKSNPPTSLMNLQRAECINILSEEIKLYKPQYIVFLTDNNWANPFIEAINDIENIKYFVIPHPQGEKEADLINNVVNHFQGISKIEIEKLFFDKIFEEALQKYKMTHGQGWYPTCGEIWGDIRHSEFNINICLEEDKFGLATNSNDLTIEQTARFVQKFKESLPKVKFNKWYDRGYVKFSNIDVISNKIAKSYKENDKKLDDESRQILYSAAEKMAQELQDFAENAYESLKYVK